MTSTDRTAKWPAGDHELVQQLAGYQLVEPVESADELARPGTFESDEELGEFLADLYRSRRADGA